MSGISLSYQQNGCTKGFLHDYLLDKLFSIGVPRHIGVTREFGGGSERSEEKKTEE
jgi:hypothetical protein